MCVYVVIAFLFEILQRRSPSGSFSMAESFNACSHEESEAHGLFVSVYVYFFIFFRLVTA